MVDEFLKQRCQLVTPTERDSSLEKKTKCETREQNKKKEPQSRRLKTNQTRNTARYGAGVVGVGVAGVGVGVGPSFAASWSHFASLDRLIESASSAGANRTPPPPPTPTPSPLIKKKIQSNQMRRRRRRDPPTATHHGATLFAL